MSKLSIVKTSPAENLAYDKPLLSREIIKRIAEDIGKDTAAYISVMYPEAAKASSSSFMMSLRNHIYNQIMAAVAVNDPQEIIQRLDERAKWRKNWLAQWRKIRNTGAKRKLQRQIT